MGSTNGTETSIQQAIGAMERMSRRDFLRLAGVAAGSAALGGAGLLAPVAARAAVPAGIRWMDEGEHGLMRRLLEVTLPVAGTPLVPLARVPVLETLDTALLGAMAPHELTGLKTGMRLFQEGPVPLYGRPFTALDDASAAAFCDAWADSPDPVQRGLVTGLKKLVTLAYWANPPTWAPLGYDGPVSARWGLTSIGNAPLPQE